MKRSTPSVWAETTFRELHDEVSRLLVVAVRFHNIAIDLVMETKVGGRDSNGGNRPKSTNTINLSAVLSLCVASSSQANQDTPPVNFRPP